MLKSYYLWVIFAEETFIVLDKDLVVGNFSHGQPHVEGQYSFLPSFLCLSRNLGKERFFFAQFRVSDFYKSFSFLNLLYF